MNRIDDAEARELARQLAIKLFEEAETKRVFKEALNEWLDKKHAEFSKSLLRSFVATLFAALIVVIMWSQGYTK